MKTILDILNFYNINTRYDFDNETITDVFCRSDLCFVKSVFVAVRGAKFDGHDFILDAYTRGCRVFVVENSDNVPRDAFAIVVTDTRRALSALASFVYDYPQRKLTVIGVTGTKGKSTVSAMIYKILNDSEKRAAIVGTLGFTMGDKTVKTQNSTPESDTLIRFMNEMVKNDIEFAVLEISSQGIKQSRVADVFFDACVMTNISFDHIGNGEHADFGEYKNYKKSVFSKAKIGIFNADDKCYSEFSSQCDGLSYGVKNDAEFNAENICNVKIGEKYGVSFNIEADSLYKIFVPMPGVFTVYNSLAAISACGVFGIPISKCASSLKTFNINGRFENVASFDGIDVIIDYAHNEDSLENALCAIRSFCDGRIICVFGAVGERSEIRRAGLGSAADRYADICVITADNPNFEDQNLISESIASHITHKPCALINDRKDAIEYAIDIAKRGDVVLIAGKGHERYQLINGQRHPFDEKDIVLQKIKHISKSKI